MTTPRRFCRFMKDPKVGIPEIPAAGFCLSAFLVITPTGSDRRVLMGRLNPTAPWDHLGALDPARVEANSRGWMLPSSHLIYGEPPPDAARRVSREQLGIEELDLEGPKVVSEAYPSIRGPHLGDHWDIEFIFRARLPDTLPRTEAWAELSFIDLARVKKADMVRFHEDIIESAGLTFGLP